MNNTAIPYILCLNKNFVFADRDDEEEGGMLYVMIEDIVKRHNEVIEKLKYFSQSQKTILNHLIPEEPHEIYVTEFEPHHGIITE